MPRVKQPPVLDPKLCEVWAKGGLEVTTITLPDENTALALRHRLYRERVKMRELKHEATAIANQGTIIIKEDDKGNYQLIVYPANLIISKALEKAGITVGEPPP